MWSCLSTLQLTTTQRGQAIPATLLPPHFPEPPALCSARRRPRCAGEDTRRAPPTFLAVVGWTRWPGSPVSIPGPVSFLVVRRPPPAPSAVWLCGCGGVCGIYCRVDIFAPKQGSINLVGLSTGPSVRGSLGVLVALLVLATLASATDPCPDADSVRPPPPLTWLAR